MSDIIDESVTELITKETAITQANAKMARFAYTEEAYTEDNAAGVQNYSFNQEQNIPLGSSSVLETNATVLDKGLRSQASSLPRMVVNHFFGRASYNLNKIHDRFLAFLNTFRKHLSQDNNLYSDSRIYTEGDVCFILYTFTDSSGADRKSLRMFRAVYTGGTFSNQSPLVEDEVNTTYWSECDYLSSFGKPNGVATLDSDGRLPYSQLPESSIEYKGNWDASTNTPALADGTGTNGDFYIVSVGGTQDLGSGSIAFLENDRVIYDGATRVWEKLSGGAVKTVNAKSPDSQGNVSLTGADINVSAFCMTKVNTILEKAVTEVNGKCVASNCHSVTLTGDDIKVSGSVTDTLGCIASLTGTVADITNANAATGTASLALGITNLVTTRGDLSALCTTCKDNLVVAMNELYNCIASSGGTPLAYFTNCYGTSCCGMSGNACGNVILTNGVIVSSFDVHNVFIGRCPNMCTHTATSCCNISIGACNRVISGVSNAIAIGSAITVRNHCEINIGQYFVHCAHNNGITYSGFHNGYEGVCIPDCRGGALIGSTLAGWSFNCNLACFTPFEVFNTQAYVGTICLNSASSINPFVTDAYKPTVMLMGSVCGRTDIFKIQACLTSPTQAALRAYPYSGGDSILLAEFDLNGNTHCIEFTQNCNISLCGLFVWS